MTTNNGRLKCKCSTGNIFLFICLCSFDSFFFFLSLSHSGTDFELIDCLVTNNCRLELTCTAHLHQTFQDQLPRNATSRS